MLPKVISNSIELIRVLHVDDDPNQYEFIKFFLNQIDPVLQVNCVATPDEVFKELKEKNYDCLVTDFQMPEMNGIELSKKVRENYNIPIILYTGQGSEEVAEAAFTIGIDDYLRKEMDPSHYQVLAKRIRQVVEKKQAETLYENVVEQTRDAISIFIEGQMVFANQSTLNLLEVKNFSKINGTNPFSVENSKGDQQSFLEIGFHELEIMGKDKKKLNIEVSTSPITYNGKEAVLCFARDITEKKMLENEKKISQKRFETLVDSSPDGITSVNPLGFVTFANKAFLELTGFSREEIVGRHITNVKTIRKRDLLGHLTNFASILRGEGVTTIEFTWQTKDGNPGIGLAHVSLIEIEGRKEVLLIVKDITNYRKKEKELDLVFEKAPYGIIKLDSSGSVLSINDTALRLSELNRNDAHGKDINTVFNIEDGNLAALNSLLNKKIKNVKETKPFELQIRSRSDESVWVEAQTCLIEVDEENYGVHLILKDITNKKRLEKERKTYAQRLEKLMQDMGQRLDSTIVSKLDKEIKINLDEIENRLTKLRYDDIVKNSEIDKIEKAVSNIIKAIDDTSKIQLMTTDQIHGIMANIDEH